MPNGSSASLSFPLLISTSFIIFLANAGLLVLQLVAGRYLAPFIGSSVETWTSVIGIFLTGIAAGNWLGGKLADKAPSTRTLGILLILGGLGSLAMIGWYYLCLGTGFHQSIPLQFRIPVLAALFCLLPAFTLSLITPLTIKLILPDVSRAGGIAGLVFALSTLGCLVGNYATGFWLMANYTLDTMTCGVGAALLALSVPAFLLRHNANTVKQGPVIIDTDEKPERDERAPIAAPPAPANWLDFRRNIKLAYCLVFLSSFCGMSLELTASRVLAPYFGVSLFTWTGVIGVMLAGTALGNFFGGFLADRIQRTRPKYSEATLSLTLLLAGSSLIVVVLVPTMLYENGFLKPFGLPYKILGWTFVLFFLPMFMLGTVSPQVIRLSVTDLQHAGRVAGTIYAWSTVGAIAGTFTTGYFLIAAIGMNRVLLVLAFLLTILAFFAGQLWKRYAALYAASLIAGGALCGLVFLGSTGGTYDLETKYYAISVKDMSESSRKDKRIEPGTRPNLKTLSLDLLIHSAVDLDDPTYLYYPHEYVQGELLRLALSRDPSTNVLIVGGGGYTFPRWVEHELPEVGVEVVEIDPGVTEIAKKRLGLAQDTKIVSHHMDGRQFISEKARKGHYQLVVQDAVNDLSVPYHLMTKEYNDAIKAALTPDGVYLLTLIDSLEVGELWRASVNTLRKSFKHVVLLYPGKINISMENSTRGVYVIYASDTPFDLQALRKAVGTTDLWTHELDADTLEWLLDMSPKVILTDQYAPVDNLMSEIFRRR
jgi:spermidine synthase/MFS family permease